MACKPGSVPAQAGDDHSSRTPVSGRLARPTRAAVRKQTSRRYAGVPPLFGLAPGGVCRAIVVTGDAVRSYRTISPLPPRPGLDLGLAVSFLWHFPWGYPRWVLPTTLPCGVRTFLPDRGSERPPSPLRPSNNIVGLFVQRKERIRSSRNSAAFARTDAFVAGRNSESTRRYAPW